MNGTIEGNAAPDVDEVEYGVDSDRGTVQRRRRIEHGVIAALVVVVLTAIALVGFRSGADEEQDGATGRPSGAASATTTEAPTTTESTPETTVADPPAGATPVPGTPATPSQPPDQPVHEHEVAPAVLDDGRHPVHLTELDTTGGNLQFDLVQWLTEDDASEYVENHPDEYPGMYEEIEELGSYPYDSLVVNENPKLRTLPLSDHPQIVVVFSESPGYEVFPHTIELAELPDYLELHRQDVETEGAVSNSVFWLTVHGGEIVAIEEQFQS